MRKMKNTLILAVMIFCLWITTGLSLAAEEEQPAQGNPANRLEEILQRGKLIVATSPDLSLIHISRGRGMNSSPRFREIR